MTVHNLQLFVVCLLSSWLSHLCLYRYSWFNEDNISDLFEYFFVSKREDAGQKKKRVDEVPFSKTELNTTQALTK